MRGLIEAAVFLGLAAGVHLILALGLPGEPGARGAGAGGEAVTSLEAAPESFSALARAWRESPDTAAPAEPRTAPDTAPQPPPEAPGDPPPDGRAARAVPVQPDDPRAEQDLPAAGPQIPQQQDAGASAPQPGSQPPELPSDSEAPAPERAAIASVRAPEGEVALPAPGPQARAEAPVAPRMKGAGGEIAGDAPAGRSAAPEGMVTPPAPRAPDAPQEESTARAASAPVALIAAAGADQPRPQPRPDPGETQPAEQESPPRPARESAADSTPRPEQQARGAGGNASAGDRQEPDNATLSGAKRQSLLASWGGAIRARVEHHKRYPAQARNRRLSGVTTVRMEVARDGRLLAAAVAASSGHEAMDRAALDAVRSAARFPAAPDELREASFRFDLPVSFRP